MKKIKGNSIKDNYFKRTPFRGLKNKKTPLKGY